MKLTYDSPAYREAIIKAYDIITGAGAQPIQSLDRQKQQQLLEHVASSTIEVYDAKDDPDDDNYQLVTYKVLTGKVVNDQPVSVEQTIRQKKGTNLLQDNKEMENFHELGFVSTLLCFR